MRLGMLFLTAALLAASVSEVGAQPPAEPPPLQLSAGSKVRVWTRALMDQRIEGTLISADAATVTLVPKGSHPLAPNQMKIATRDVARLELALETKRHWWQGALIGAAAFGLLVGLTSDVDSTLCKVNEDVLCSRGEAFAVGAAGGGIIGLVVGGLIKSDRYVPVAVDALGPPSAAFVKESRAPFSFQVTLRF